jgi:hypothetical protein
MQRKGRKESGEERGRDKKRRKGKSGIEVN